VKKNQRGGRGRKEENPVAHVEGQLSNTKNPEGEVGTKFTGSKEEDDEKKGGRKPQKRNSALVKS